jgi:hypothetical protein
MTEIFMNLSYLLVPSNQPSVIEPSDAQILAYLGAISTDPLVVAAFFNPSPFPNDSMAAFLPSANGSDAPGGRTGKLVVLQPTDHDVAYRQSTVVGYAGNTGFFVINQNGVRTLITSLVP